MEYKISTEKLQEMCNKAIRCAGRNKMIPITSLMAFSLSNGVLTLTTTDATNYLYVSETDMPDGELYCVFPVETFTKLVTRTTTEYTTFVKDEDKITVTGNGKYEFSLILEDDGTQLQYPSPYVSTDDRTEVSLDLIKTIFDYGKASVATTWEVPCYTGFYLSDKAITTDGYKVCGVNLKVTDRPLLIPYSMMSLVDCLDGDKVRIVRDDSTGQVMFRTQKCTIVGYVQEGIEDFDVDSINGLLDNTPSNKVKIPRVQLVDVLERVALFVDTYDQNAITLTFENSGVTLSSMAMSGVEYIDYSGKTEAEPLSIRVDINLLLSQIKVHVCDDIEVYYDTDGSFITIMDGNMTQVVSLLD